MTGNVKLSGERAAAGPNPVPVRVICNGALVASSTIERFAAKLPIAVGVKVTSIWQAALGARLVPQLLVSAKSPASAPVIAILVSASTAVPVLVTVIGVGTLVVPTTIRPSDIPVVDGVVIGNDP